MAIAAQPADAGAKSGIRSDHTPVTERTKGCGMRVQEPGAGPAAADQRQFQRCLFAGQNIAQAGADGCPTDDGENLFMVLRADTTKIAFVDVARLRL
jgi:hypothetical protein